MTSSDLWEMTRPERLAIDWKLAILSLSVLDSESMKCLSGVIARTPLRPLLAREKRGLRWKEEYEQMGRHRPSGLRVR